MNNTCFDEEYSYLEIKRSRLNCISHMIHTKLNASSMSSVICAAIRYFSGSNRGNI